MKLIFDNFAIPDMLIEPNRSCVKLLLMRIPMLDLSANLRRRWYVSETFSRRRASLLAKVTIKFVLTIDYVCFDNTF